MSLARASALIGGLTLISRVLGFLREALLARYLGAGWVSDCFFVAFKLPNLFRRLFAEGAFAAAFVPIVSGLLGQTPDDQGPAKRFAEDALSVLLMILVGFTALAMILMPLLVLVMTGGFQNPEPGQFALAVELSRLTFPYLLLISLVSLLGGVLNSVGKFGAAAASPILLNICMIAAVLLVNDTEQSSARAVAAGVAVAGVAQLLWLIWVCERSGVSLRLRWPKLSPELRQFGRTVLPAIIGQGAMQINLLVDTFLATRFLPQGSLSYIYYADRLNQLPLGVIGIAVGTALLPAISRSLGAGDAKGATQTQNRGIELALLFALPAAFALILLAEPLVRLSYERGAFQASDTGATAGALMAFASGLPAYILIKVLTPGFFARGDTATPVKIAVIAMGANFVLNLALIWTFKHVGIAASTAISAWLNAALLFYVLRRRGHFAIDAQLASRAPRMLISATVMAVLVGSIYWAARPIFAEQGISLAIGVLGLVITSLPIYFGVSLWSGAVSKQELLRILRREKKT
jgi:putative peptidoglycan lipid II flippase